MALSTKKRRRVGVISLTLAGLAVSAWHHANGESVAPKEVAAKAETSLVRAIKVEPKEIDDVRAAMHAHRSVLRRAVQRSRPRLLDRLHRPVTASQEASRGARRP